MTDFNPFNVPEFRKELSEMLDDKLSPLTTKVAEHETILQQRRGGLLVVGGMWTGFTALLITGLEFMFHRKG